MEEDRENKMSSRKLETDQLRPTTTIKKVYDFFINDNESNKKFKKFKNNSITTTKYNIFIFLPKCLLLQFMRLANCYFLFIAIIQSITVISPLDPSTAWGPICLVLSASMLREAWEDYQRYKYDKLLNSEETTAYRNNKWEVTTSGTLEMGEIVIVEEDKPFPADLILLDSNLEEGVAFIETGTLDGEKTLKNKISKKETAGYFNNGGSWRSDFKMKGKSICDYPNSELYKLDGSIELSFFDSEEKRPMKIPIDAKQMLLKGANLRNTKWVIGIVVYTGHNTKLILNSKPPKVKYSRIEKMMSNLLIFILFLQISFCILCSGMFSVYWNHYIVDVWYIPPLIDSTPNMPFAAFLNYFTYNLLLNTMIPISLIITLEIVKSVQGGFIQCDVEGYSHIRKKTIKAGSISLNEELGQVNFIFSDKTGTLTCNKMMFKYCVIGDVCHEFIRTFSEDELKTVVGYEGDDKRIREEMDIQPFGIKHMHRYATSEFKTKMTVGASKYPKHIIKSETQPEALINLEHEADLIEEFWKALALCHECTVEEKETNTFDYSGLSPDDIELVKTASLQGYELKKSSIPSIRKVSISGEERDFEVLNILEFNSDRKRASVIVKEKGLIKLYIKGADTIILQRLHQEGKKEFLDQAKNYVNYFSNKGFRTLFVGMKILHEDEYETWKNKLNEANLNLENRKTLVDQVYEEVESKIHLIGATIVEDKLQEKVPETIRDLRLAGIKIWMLTGDKMDTAYNIGLSCNLISNDLQIFKIAGEKGDTLDKLIQDFKNFRMKHPHTIPPFAIIIDAVALTLILKKDIDTRTFLDIAYYAASVICCRVTPLQKSDVVRIMREYDSSATTLAVGDGGNDVSMIMEAHIGVGVYGEEGMRAVQSGDFAIGEFKILRRLLLFHGRTNNIRVSEMILYFFYKNFVFTLVHFYFAFYNNCSGQTIIDDWYITLYNLLFTCFPLGFRACVDQDVVPDDGKIIYQMMPFMYQENRENQIFTKRSFLLGLFRGIVHGLINFFFIIFVFQQAAMDSEGFVADMWFMSVLIYTNIIFVSLIYNVLY
jgi:phospholipid-transporting ATPase